MRYYRTSERLFCLAGFLKKTWRKIQMTQDELKRKVAEAALPYIKGVPVIGVGTG